MICTVTDVKLSPQGGIHAIKAMRAATGYGLKQAKVDVFDRVRAGEQVSIDVDSLLGVDHLVEHGWSVVIDDETLCSLKIFVPVEHRAMITKMVNAIGGKVA